MPSPSHPQRMKQRQRILASGQSDQHAVAISNHVEVTDGAANASAQATGNLQQVVNGWEIFSRIENIRCRLQVPSD